jgi:hypothetical protein
MRLHKMLRSELGALSCYRAGSFPMALVSCARLHTGFREDLFFSDSP